MGRSGPSGGKTPTYAPDYQLKTSAIYRWKDVVKVGLLGTIVDDEFGDAIILSSVSFPRTTFGI